MRIKNLLFVTCVTVLFLSLISCGISMQQPDVLHSETADMGQVTDVYPESEVQRIDDGLWMHKPGYGWYMPPAYAFWIDIKVKNLAFEKSVGIWWTNDNWATTNTAYASYEEGMDNGYEKWGIDVYLERGRSSNIEYAVFATMDGNTWYDPANNHLIGVLGDKAVKFMGGNVESDGASATFTGVVKVENIAYEKIVNIIWTKDNWQTALVTSADYCYGNDWTFELPLDFPDTTNIEFAVEYIVDGQTYWDNNQENNYTYQIGPNVYLYTSAYGDSHTSYLSGFEMIFLNDNNYNTNSTIEAEVNGTAVEFQGNNWLQVLINTLDFYPEEELTLTLSITDDKGFYAESTFEYTTDKFVEPGQSFLSDELVWPYNLKIRDNTMIISDNDQKIVFLYDLITKTYIEITTEHKVRDADFDADGNVVVLINDYSDPMIQIYETDSTLLKTIDLPETLIDIPVAMETTETEILLLSYVDDKVLKIDYDGIETGSFSVPYAQKVKLVDGLLWTATSYPYQMIRAYDLDGTLVEDIDLSDTGIPGYNEFGHFDDIAVNDDYIVILDSYKFVVLDRDYNFRYKWTGRSFGSSSDVDGVISSTANCVEINDGTIYVGDFSHHKIHTFDQLGQIIIDF